MISAKAQVAVELADEVTPETARPFSGHAVNFAAPSGRGMLARQELGKETKHDQMKAKTALLKIALHDPVGNSVKGLAGQSSRATCLRTVTSTTRRKQSKGFRRCLVHRHDSHDDFAFLRAS
jgi:hypothetical protein